MILRYIFFAIIILGSQAVHAGSIIKCQASDGSITYADTRCPAGQKQLSKKTHQQRRISEQTTPKNLENAAEFPDEKQPAKIPSLLFQSQFAQVLSSLQVIKLSVVEYYIYRGRWPGSLQDIGYVADEMTSSLIVKTELSSEGRIQARLNQQFGDNKEVWLYPRMVMGGTQIEWSCYTNFPANRLQNPVGITLCESRFF